MRDQINSLKGENIRLREEIIKINVNPNIEDMVPKVTSSEQPTEEWKDSVMTAGIQFPPK